MKITVRDEIRRSQSELFDLSQNYDRRMEWDSYLSEAYLLHGATAAGTGIDSFCRSTSGAVLISRYVSYKPPVVAAVTMTQGPAVLQRFSGSWRFKPLGSTLTEVAFTYNFRTRPAWLRWLVEPVVAYFYRRDMIRRLAAFKAWAEAGA